MNLSDTIIAPATAPGAGAIALIRLSGSKAYDLVGQVFASKDLKPRDIKSKAGNTIVFGVIHQNKVVIDEVLISLFKAPHSYTGEDLIEISCHGSSYIVQQILLLFTQLGARMAEAGEFTLRAFLNKKMDLSQAEAVADLIASESEAAHKLAMQQMRGGFSKEIEQLRSQLIEFASLIELELDFGEEDVEFANRSDLQNLVIRILNVVSALLESFSLGNVIKKGIPVAIMGKPNAGKSTLLNTLLHEERAIVSEIPGTTRDSIEESIVLGGYTFRFIDTAGLRHSDDTIETLGIARSYEKAQNASVILYIFDCTVAFQLQEELAALKEKLGNTQASFILIANKSDQVSAGEREHLQATNQDWIMLSAKNKDGILQLTQTLEKLVENKVQNQVIVGNARHAEALQHAKNSLEEVLVGLQNGTTGDFIAMDIRQALYYLGLITGEISSDDLLGSIFTNFCIGK